MTREEAFIEWCARNGHDETEDSWDLFEATVADGPESPFGADTREEARGER